MDRESLADDVAKTAGELRIQLAQITAAGQLLERAARRDEDRRCLAVINQSVCRMLRAIGRMELTHRLTDLAEARAFPAHLDLSELTEGLGSRVESVLSCAGVRFTWSAPGRLPAWADGALIRQMLLELICNAAAAGKNVKLTLARRGGKACFTVSDDGPGIPPGKLGRIFDGGEDPAGRGIPLAQRIVQLHGGSLMADSAPGQGLTMVAVLPLREGPADGLLESPGVPAPAGGFDEALIALSELLPAAAFLPDGV